MSDKSSRHEIIRGVIIRPFYIYENTHSYLLFVKRLLSANYELWNI